MDLSDLGLKPINGEEAPDQQKPEINPPAPAVVENPPVIGEKKEDTPPVFDWKTTFGDQYDAPEKIKPVLDEYKTLKDQVGSLTEKEKFYMEQLSSKAPDIDETLLLMDQLGKKTNIKDWGLLNNIVSESFAAMSDIDKIVLRKVLDNPSLKGREELIRAKVEKDLGIQEFDPDDSWTDDELAKEKSAWEKQQRLAKFGLETEAQEAEKYFKNLKSELKPSAKVDLAEQFKQSKEQHESKLKEATNVWNGVYDELAKKILTVQVPMANEDKIVPFVDFAVSPEEMTASKEEVVSYMVSNNIPLDKESLPVMHQMMQNMVILNNLPKIISAAVGKAKQELSEKYDRAYHNPSQLDKKDIKDDKTGLSKSEQADRDILSRV